MMVTKEQLDNFFSSRDATIGTCGEIANRAGKVAGESLDESRKQTLLMEESNRKSDKALRISTAALVVAVIAVFIAIVIGVAQIAWAH